MSRLRHGWQTNTKSMPKLVSEETYDRGDETQRSTCW